MIQTRRGNQTYRPIE